MNTTNYLLQDQLPKLLHTGHDLLFGVVDVHMNPWIDHLRHIYHDIDHLQGLLVFVIGTIVVPCTLIVYFLCWSNHQHNVVAAAANKKSNNINNNMSRRKALTTLVLLLLLVAMGQQQQHHHEIHMRPTIIKGTDPFLQDLLELCPLIQRGPQPPFWLRNRHWQLAPWLFQNYIHAIPGIPYQRLEFNVTDCIDKSIPNCTTTDSMKDTITLDIFPPLILKNNDNNNDNNNNLDQHTFYNFSNSAPVILFLPGLRCHSQDLPGNSIVRTMYGKGFRSIVINRRGHTPNTLLKAPRWNLFGDVDDLEQVYWYTKNTLIDLHTPMFLHGISSGTATLVSALASWDKRAKLFPNSIPTPSFVGAVALSPGYDISKVLRPERFKWPYNPLLTHSVKDHFLVQNRHILQTFNSTAYQLALAATSLQGVVDAAAPFAGYPTAESYYNHCNPINEMQYISTPTYVLNAVDDPCCPIDNLFEISTRHNGLSYADIAAKSERSMVVVTKSGSHCPFLDTNRFWWWPFVQDPYTNNIMLNSWADQSIAEFYVAALHIYNNRKYL